MRRQKGGTGRQIKEGSAAEGQFRQDCQTAATGLGLMQLILDLLQCTCKITDKRIGLNEGDLQGDMTKERQPCTFAAQY